MELRGQVPAFVGTEAEDGSVFDDDTATKKSPWEMNIYTYGP